MKFEELPKYAKDWMMERDSCDNFDVESLSNSNDPYYFKHRFIRDGEQVFTYANYDKIQATISYFINGKCLEDITFYPYINKITKRTFMKNNGNTLAMWLKSSNRWTIYPSKDWGVNIDNYGISITFENYFIKCAWNSSSIGDIEISSYISLDDKDVTEHYEYNFDEFKGQHGIIKVNKQTLNNKNYTWIEPEGNIDYILRKNENNIKNHKKEIEFWKLFKLYNRKDKSTIDIFIHLLDSISWLPNVDIEQMQSILKLNELNNTFPSIKKQKLKYKHWVLSLKRRSETKKLSDSGVVSTIDKYFERQNERCVLEVVSIKGKIISFTANMFDLNDVKLELTRNNRIVRTNGSDIKNIDIGFLPLRENSPVQVWAQHFIKILIWYVHDKKDNANLIFIEEMMKTLEKMQDHKEGE